MENRADRNLLPTSPDEWDQVRELARVEKSDGCTGVADFYVDCCYLHDHFYRVGEHWKVGGGPVTRAEADKALRQCIQSRSKFGRFSPMSWIRWAGVRLGRFVGFGYAGDK